jgi:hypothetical protein
MNKDNNKRGKVGYTTYFVLIAIQCTGLPLSFLISSPQKVIRGDGSRLPDPTLGKSIKRETRKLFKLLLTKRVFLMIPILVGFNWNNTYQGIYITRYFSVRTRALAALTSGIAATAANIFWGWALDRKFATRPTIAKAAWAIFAVNMFALFGWQVYNEYTCSNTVPKITIDWADAGFGKFFASNVMFRFWNESHYMFVYWIIGTFNNDVETLTLTVGIVRCFESLGSAVSYGIGAAQTTPMTNLIVAFCMFAFAAPWTTWLVFLVPERPDEIDPTRLSDLDVQSLDERLESVGDEKVIEPSVPVVAAKDAL